MGWVLSCETGLSEVPIHFSDEKATSSHATDGEYMNWEKMRRLVDLFFPPIRILHPMPCHRFDARTRGRSPVR